MAFFFFSLFITVVTYLFQCQRGRISKKGDCDLCNFLNACSGNTYGGLSHMLINTTVEHLTEQNLCLVQHSVSLVLLEHAGHVEFRQNISSSHFHPPTHLRILASSSRSKEIGFFVGMSQFLFLLQTKENSSGHRVNFSVLLCSQKSDEH